MTDHSERLRALRAQLKSRKLDGFIVPLTDEHMSEYVGLYARRLEWLTGFSGSAGLAAVLMDKAAIFIDGRYTLQVRQQVDAADYAFQSVPAEPVWNWLGANAPRGARIGFDPWLANRANVRASADALAPLGAELVPVSDNPIDAIWTDRPAPSTAPVEIQPLEFAGTGAAEKRRRIAGEMRARKADSLILSALDEIAWLFNIRGTDVPRTPVARAFAILRKDATATLFIDATKLDDAVIAHLGPDVDIRPYGALPIALAGLNEERVWIDPQSAVYAIQHELERVGADVIEARSPVVLAKAVKNDVELAGARAAHLRDGAALTRFLQWVDAEAGGGDLDELKAEERLERFRRESNLLKDLSFDSISGFGPNGAIVHYRATEKTNRRFQGDTLYLIDSGGQYSDGTTDVTRTVAIGTPSAEMRDRFTRVLKGHIALSTARFPKGTRGGQLDILARQFLWSVGQDYAHGTGHGVGSFLSVHEGPQRIASALGAPGVEEPLLPGMILSNEPGYYKADGFGIRIENLVVVREDPRDGDSQPMLAFENLTLAPIDLRLVEPALMTEAEMDWLDSYHARVYAEVSPLLDPEARQRLAGQTRPVRETLRTAA